MSEKNKSGIILADLAENSNFLWKFIKIDNLWKSILQNLRHLFKAFQWSDDQIPKLYNTNNRLNVTELLTTIKTSTKQTKKTSKIIDLRGRLKTADNCGAVCQAGGKLSTWFPPGRLVEQSGVKEKGIYTQTTRRKQSEKVTWTKRGSRNHKNNKTRHDKIKPDGARPKRDEVEAGWEHKQDSIR